MLNLFYLSSIGFLGGLEIIIPSEKHTKLEKIEYIFLKKLNTYFLYYIFQKIYQNKHFGNIITTSYIMELEFDSFKRRQFREKRKLNKILLLDDIVIQLDMNKKHLDSIMYNILTKVCSSNVVGYNDYRDFYWVKFYNNLNHNLLLHVEINLNELLDNKCKIIFKTKFGDLKTVNDFVFHFKDIIDTYQKSEIMQYILDEM